MKILNNIFLSNIRLIMITFVVFFLASTWGCDPIQHTEFYKGTFAEAPQSTILLRILRIGDKYESGPDVRFIDDEGIIWELRLLSNDPKYWSLVRIQRDGTHEVIPLHLVDTSSGLGYSSSPVWPEK